MFGCQAVCASVCLSIRLSICVRPAARQAYSPTAPTVHPTGSLLASQPVVFLVLHTVPTPQANKYLANDTIHIVDEYSSQCESVTTIASNFQTFIGRRSGSSRLMLFSTTAFNTTGLRNTRSSRGASIQRPPIYNVGTLEMHEGSQEWLILL